MEEVRQYILSVICVAILSCLIQTPIAGKGGVATAVKIATGLVLTVTVFTPILNLGNFRLKDVDMAIKELTKEMQLAAKNLMFERAALLRDKIAELKAEQG